MRRRHPHAIGAMLVLIMVRTTLAQNGDRSGENQRDMPDHWRVDATPILDPHESREAMVVEPGLRIDLVASEPLIGDPVQIRFDAKGDLWVLEMRGYMPDADGSNEREPVGRVVRLRDADGDGRMDEQSIFLDHLILPRAIAPAFDGILVVEPPHLLFARDLDGDGRCDETQVLASNFGGLENPEHAGNGLRYGIDNWYETSQHHQSFRIRRRADGRIEVETRNHPGHGQWGVARDDVGRLFYSPNSDPLIGDEFPKHYAGRNSGVGDFPPHPRRVVEDRTTWPIRRTPGVNRGYQDGVLREDGTLQSFTAACSPEIYRGTAITDAYGDAFVCEPAGNLVKRFDLVERDGFPLGTPHHVDREFLASTDERFRPVSLATGPDGGLYVADFARGIVQHRIYMTTWLRNQVEDRGLAGPIGRGRVWRVADDDSPFEGTPPPMDRMDDDRLVEILADDANGWRRDTAQRLLVERMAIGVADPLRAVAQDMDRSIGSRIQAMWTLQGIDRVDSTLAADLLRDPDPRIREHAARLAESLAPHISGPMIVDLVDDADERVRIQAILSLGELPSSEAFSGFESALAVGGDDPDVRAAVRSGLADREIQFLRSRGRPTARGWLAESGSSQRTFISELVAALLKRRHPRDSTTILALALAWNDSRPDRSMVLLEQVASTTRVETETPRLLLLEGEPAGWEDLMVTFDPDDPNDQGIAGIAWRIDPHLRWPGRFEGDIDLSTLDPRKQVDRGRRLYSHCMSCHQPNGQGLPPLYPPLDGSRFVTGDPRRLAMILMHGIEGPIEVLGRTYNHAMPATPLSRDVDVAAVMTYIRQAWSNDATPVDPGLVESVRDDHIDRRAPWTMSDLDDLTDSPPE